MRRALVLGLAVAAFSFGYCRGTQPNSNAPIAEGFLDVPNTYRVVVEPNSFGEREVYLTNGDERLPLHENTPRLLRTYESKTGRVVMDGALRTVETGQQVYEYLK